MMNWMPVYIHGREGFEIALERHLAQSGYRHLPGASEEECLYLCWIEEGTPIRDLKEVIGARLVLKYRLYFFTSIDDYRAFESCNESLYITE